MTSDEINEKVRKAARVLLSTIRGYECESFGHDVLEAAIMDVERALALEPAGRGVTSSPDHRQRLPHPTQDAKEQP